MPFSGKRKRERSDRCVRPSATAGWAAHRATQAIGLGPLRLPAKDVQSIRRRIRRQEVRYRSFVPPGTTQKRDWPLGDPGRLDVGVLSIRRLVDVFVLPNERDRKSTRLNSSHLGISYAVF